jgi:hypothetical protein
VSSKRVMQTAETVRLEIQRNMDPVRH